MLETMFYIELEEVDGRPALWECGGGINDATGTAIIICNADGSKKRPVCILDDPNDAHALFIIEVGDVIIQASYSDGWRKECMIDEIEEICYDQAILKGINDLDCYSGEWRFPFDKKFKKAVKAAFTKMRHRNCRRVYYALPL